MYRNLFVLTLLLTLGVSEGLIKPAKLSACTKSELESAERTAPLFKNLGNYHYPISTKNSLAQRYFDQGLILAYGFNHAEAARSFSEAAKLDPNCAMCYWGIALVLGPNINAPMNPEALPDARQALQKALALSQNATEKERAYIQALAKRYPSEPVEDRSPLDIAYANAMREVAQRYRDDLDAATLFAEALMDTTPWDYWEDNGDPKPEGKEIIATLEYILERNPNHPGANHLYIHAVEKERPELGVASADRLRNLVPDSGHLVHMPSHIYLRVGRYDDASLANERAIAADESYIAQTQEQGFYPALYYSHNIHFLAYSAAMEGRSQTALNAARKIASHIQPEQASQIAELQWVGSTPLFMMARFGQWDEILKQPQPLADLPYMTGIWHYARGLAFATKGQLDEAVKESKSLQQIAQRGGLESLEVVSGEKQIAIADKVLQAEIAGLRGDKDEKIRLLETAVQVQDELPYMEPPYWYFPVRQFLGAALLEANRPVEAEAVYREDLEQHPNNGWSLFGLAQSLEVQGKTEEAKAIQSQFEDAWKDADVTLKASRF